MGGSRSRRERASDSLSLRYRRDSSSRRQASHPSRCRRRAARRPSSTSSSRRACNRPSSGCSVMVLSLIPCAAERCLEPTKGSGQEGAYGAGSHLHHLGNLPVAEALLTKEKHLPVPGLQSLQGFPHGVHRLLSLQGPSRSRVPPLPHFPRQHPCTPLPGSLRPESVPGQIRGHPEQPGPQARFRTPHLPIHEAEKRLLGEIVRLVRISRHPLAIAKQRRIDLSEEGLDIRGALETQGAFGSDDRPLPPSGEQRPKPAICDTSPEGQRCFGRGTRSPREAHGREGRPPPHQLGHSPAPRPSVSCHPRKPPGGGEGAARCGNQGWRRRNRGLLFSGTLRSPPSFPERRGGAP